MATNLPELLGATETAKLAEHAANALRRMILLQRPWGEFRELIPQSLETLASRGREAQQYRYVAKPKIFASFEIIRTLTFLATGPLKDHIQPHLENAARGFAGFLKRSFASGLPDRKRHGIWIADFRLEMPSHHSAGLQNLQLVNDFRHTAEAAHFLIEMGGANLDDCIRHKDMTCSYSDVVGALMTDFEDQGTDPTTGKHALVERAHLCNLLRYVKRISGRSTFLDRVRANYRAVTKTLAEDCPKGIWLTGGLGPIWGTSFILHLLGRNAPRYGEALGRLSERLQKLTQPNFAAMMVEANLQAFLTLAEQDALDGTHGPALRELVELLDWESMELGESAYTVQLASRILPPDVWAAAAQSSLKKLAEVVSNERLTICVSAFAEEMAYLIECEGQAKSRDRGGPSFDGRKRARSRLKRIMPVLNDQLKVRQAPLMEKADGEGKLPLLLKHFEDILKALAPPTSPLEMYPDTDAFRAQLLKPSLKPRDREGDLGVPEHGNKVTEDVPEHVDKLIRDLWRGTEGRVVYSPIVPGLSGAGVYMTQSSGSWPRVVKYGNKKVILNEVRRYRRFVRGKLPGAPLLFGPEHRGHSYGIAYEYAAQRTPSGQKSAIGATLDEIVEQTVRREWEGGPEVYKTALEQAWQSLKQWHQAKPAPSRPLYTFDGATKRGVYHFYRSEEKIYALIQEAQQRAAAIGCNDFGDLLDKIKAVFWKYSRDHADEGLGLVHGDFHPGNVFVILRRRGDLPVDSHAYKSKSDDEFISAIPIDYGNVSDGQVLLMDAGKFMRDLRERSVSKCFKDWPANDRLQVHKELAESNTRSDRVSRSRRILSYSLNIFNDIADSNESLQEENPSGPSLELKASLLYFEVTLLCWCFEDWAEGGERHQMWRRKYADWDALEYATSAILYGIRWAADR